ncbi:putative ferric-chelate reductase 1 homolog [Bradysia coprophila]|uniref:putative ferric-chelate reductase 1 homolog n=1 Tax=Bradysia coprophila TaxID=38358 RepID=UPI00187D9FAC|nr:putative ferric-chelate reductase 1 homolog [Bradysia coprophila]
MTVINDCDGASDACKNANSDDILDEKILVRIHGSMMIVAWIGFASVGIIISRYFKTTWVKHKVFGSDLWFFLHRMLMIITWCLTIISFAVIFIDLDGWANPYPHEIFGIIATVICFLQPIIAMFRPNVSSPKRKYFNLTHIFCGFLAYGLAIIAMFFAVPLHDSGLPSWINWVMTAFLVFHLLSHVFFTMLNYKSDAIMLASGAEHSSLHDDPMSTHRKIGLYAYIIINVLFIVTLVTVVGMGMEFGNGNSSGEND